MRAATNAMWVRTVIAMMRARIIKKAEKVKS